MQRELFTEDLSDKRVLVSLSAGINSAAVLCYLASEYPAQHRPKQLFIFYSHLREHSPDSFRFVRDCIRYAQKHWACVTWKIVRGSAIQFFEKQHIIPHPILSPCSEQLKWKPAKQFIEEHFIDIDMIGFIRSERNRIHRQLERGERNKRYPIAHLTESECFQLVDREIGWHPAIYDIRENGHRVFHHNNCLPCKNMQGFTDGIRFSGDYANVRYYFPDYYERAAQLAILLGSYWGRKKDFDGYCKLCEFD